MASGNLACATLAMVALGLALLHPTYAQNTVADYLGLHNYARAMVGVAPLSWDTDIQADAQNYANQLAGACTLQHSQGPYGENLYMGYGDAAEVVGTWVGESHYYDPSSNQCISGQVCGHYTQVVWGDTQRVGCGRSQCSSGAYIVVCNYDPQGNWVGQRPF
ncbi:pathogenesis-related protein 1B-like [Wolffia australiana]